MIESVPPQSIHPDTQRFIEARARTLKPGMIQDIERFYGRSFEQVVISEHFHFARNLRRFIFVLTLSIPLFLSFAIPFRWYSDDFLNFFAHPFVEASYELWKAWGVIWGVFGLPWIILTILSAIQRDRQSGQPVKLTPKRVGQVIAIIAFRVGTEKWRKIS